MALAIPTCVSHDWFRTIAMRRRSDIVAWTRSWHPCHTENNDALGGGALLGEVQARRQLLRELPIALACPVAMAKPQACPNEHDHQRRHHHGGHLPKAVLSCGLMLFGTVPSWSPSWRSTFGG